MRDPDSLYRRNVPGYSNLELFSGTKTGTGWNPVQLLKQVLKRQNDTRNHREEKARISSGFDFKSVMMVENVSGDSDIISRSFPCPLSDS